MNSDDDYDNDDCDADDKEMCVFRHGKRMCFITGSIRYLTRPLKTYAMIVRFTTAEPDI